MSLHLEKCTPITSKQFKVVFGACVETIEMSSAAQSRKGVKNHKRALLLSIMKDIIRCSGEEWEQVANKSVTFTVYITTSYYSTYRIVR